MCQLLGMNCNVPTDICFSFEGFQARGGLTDDHSHGWGIAFFEGRGCRLFVDAKASALSPIADLVKHYPIHSTNVVAHIRKATQGKICLENTHPFRRELWGKYWIFAHNGDLKSFSPKLRGRFNPVGETDSERAFCYLLEFINEKATSDATPGQIHQVLKPLAQEINNFGTFNFLLSDGEVLYAHCSTQLHYIVRQAPFKTAHLVDADVSVDFSEVTTPDDRVAVIATTPLTDDEQWTPLEKNELLMFDDGLPVSI